MTTFVLATHNAHKVGELRRILGDRLGPHELVGYDGPDAVEDADTFEGNALIKARAAFAHTGLPALADDSGIAVDALGGEPGIHSARYAGTRDDGDNLRLLLRNLEGVADRRPRRSWMRTGSSSCAASGPARCWRHRRGREASATTRSSVPTANPAAPPS